jgi:hypothetical protein
VQGSPRFVARFVVDDALGQVTSPDGSIVFGSTSAFTFDPGNTGLGPAFPDVTQGVEVFITQEPQGVNAAAPSDVVVLAGLQVGTASSLTVAGQSSTGGRGIADFISASGSLTCFTPTTDQAGVPFDDGRGVWFRLLDDEVPSLMLPLLPPQWRYEGWVVNTATNARYSTGRFSRPSAADEDAMTWKGRGPVNTGFTVPGQDFVTAFAGTPVPAQPDLRAGWTVSVTIEPSPDNSPAPFYLTLLTGPLPSTTLTPSAPLANTSAAFPTGRVEWQ